MKKFANLKDDSQNSLILAHLMRGRSLTQLSALRLFGCLRLGARCYELKRRGHRIKSEMVSLTDGKRVARYSWAKKTPGGLPA